MITITPLEDWLIKTALVAMGLIIGYFLQKHLDSKKPDSKCIGECNNTGAFEKMLLIHVDLATLKSEVRQQSKLLQSLSKQIEEINRKFGSLHDEHLVNHKPP
ncbi:MAG: hypothetical protein WCO63_16065 [Bacteroidota bacterium]